MMDRDMRPTRFGLTLQYAREFILEWFDQNPLGQMGVVGMRAGVGERIADMSGRSCQVLNPYTTQTSTGNPQDVLKAISDRHKLEPTGEPSLQNAIEMARNSMKYESYTISVQLSDVLEAIYRLTLLGRFSLYLVPSLRATQAIFMTLWKSA